MATKHTLTVSEKVQLIPENENNTSSHTLAENFKTSVGSVSNRRQNISNPFYMINKEVCAVDKKILFHLVLTITDINIKGV
jgi:hypothetical protein